MVVAVVLVGVVQAAADEVIGVVAVRDGFVPAVGAVSVRAYLVSGGRGVTFRVLGVDGDRVLVDVVVVGVVQVPVVKVVDVSAVPDGDVSAAGTMLVVVRLVREMF